MQILGIVWKITKKPVREKKITYTNPMVRNSILSFTLFSKFERTTPWWVKDAFGVNFQVPDESITKSERERDAEVFSINIQSSWYHATRHSICKWHVQRSMRPEAVLRPKTTESAQETTDEMDKRFITSAIWSIKKYINV